jgi:Uma2 family endonuclease
MSQTALASPTIENLDDLVERLGSIPLRRIRFIPPPGTATEDDVVAVHDRTNHLCELLDGVLVEKAMGFYEARMAAALIGLLEEFLTKHDLGIVLSSDGMMRLAPGLVRIPDVSFLSWSHFPNRELPREPIPDIAPDLAVEVLSESNTKAEMQRKLWDYFDAGVRLVWYLDPETRTAEVYTGVDQCRRVREVQSLDGGDVLPGFSLPLSLWFARAGKRRSD